MEAAANFYDEKTGDDLIHVVKETPISFLTSYNVPKTSPFISTLNNLLIAVKEFGFFEKTNLNILNYLNLKRIQRFKKALKIRYDNRRITLVHLGNVFKFFLSLIFISFITFLMELVVHWWKFKKSSVQKANLRKNLKSKLFLR